MIALDSIRWEQRNSCQDDPATLNAVVTCFRAAFRNRPTSHPDTLECELVLRGSIIQSIKKHGDDVFGGCSEDDLCPWATWPQTGNDKSLSLKQTNHLQSSSTGFLSTEFCKLMIVTCWYLLQHAVRKTARPMKTKELKGKIRPPTTQESLQC